MFILILSSLIGCMAYHREVDSNGNTTIRSSSGYHGTSVLTHDEIAAQVLSKAANGVPVNVVLDANGNARFSVGYSGGYRSVANDDWYLRGQQAVQRRAEQMAGGSVMGTGWVSASNVALDVKVTCPQERDPATVAERLACNQQEIDGHTIAIENNPAVRR